jgi:hypothetical protein
MIKNLLQAAIALSFFAGIGMASAQNVSPAIQDANPATATNLQLSSDQKHTIYLSISNQPQKETAPPAFRAAVGAVLPPSVNSQPLPKTIVDLMPQTKEYEYAMVANQVLLIDPKSKQVVEVINE